MKRIYNLIAAISVMLLIVLLFTGCSKSSAEPQQLIQDDMGTQHNFAVKNSDGVSIGSIVFTKEEDGNARVQLQIDKNVLANFTPAFNATLQSSTLPFAQLQPLDAEGKSDTYPVVSSNKGLTASYNSLMYMRDLKLVINDAHNMSIVVADVH